MGWTGEGTCRPLTYAGTADTCWKSKYIIRACKIHAFATGQKLVLGILLILCLCIKHRYTCRPNIQYICGINIPWGSIKGKRPKQSPGREWFRKTWEILCKCKIFFSIPYLIPGLLHMLLCLLKTPLSTLSTWGKVGTCASIVCQALGWVLHLHHLR